jgi:hypothetical protein
MTVVLAIVLGAFVSAVVWLVGVNAGLRHRVRCERRWRIEAYRWLDEIDPPRLARVPSEEEMRDRAFMAGDAWSPEELERSGRCASAPLEINRIPERGAPFHV